MIMQILNRFAAVLIGSLIVSSGNLPLLAQIQADNTLGAEQSLIAPGVIQGMPSDVVNGGARRGVNLFHSFLNFNVADGQRVYFGNPTGVFNILTRITGNNPSAILGTLGVDGGANLFLLNPNGILFGVNSRLDIRGSFTATTANSFTFPDGGQFSATQPNALPLLTINITPGLQYGTSPANITNAGKLEVGGNLMLAGGSIITTGQLRAAGDLTLAAQNIVQIRDSVTAPFIAQAGGILLVQGNQTVDIFALNHPGSGLFSGSDMVLRSPTSVIGDAHYWAGGNFRIEQLNHQPGNLVSPNDPIIRTSGDFTINGYIGSSLHILAGGRVTIVGGVQIIGPGLATDTLQETITLSDGRTINIDGAAVPTLDIRAGTLNVGTPGLANSSGFIINPPPPISLAPANLNQAATGSDIFIGDINITASNGVVLLTNNYAPNQMVPGGNITVQGTDFFNTDSGTGIQTNLAASGNSGSVAIDARNSILLNTPIHTHTATGNTGDVKLLARNNIISNAQINTSSDGGNAGQVTLNAGGSIALNAPISTRSSTGVAGNVELLARNDIFSNAQIDTRATGGNAGQVTLSAGDNLLIDRSITTDVRPGSFGNAGDVRLTAPQITIRNGAQVSANTFGSGAGGNIQVNAQQLTLQNNAQISSITGDDLRNNSSAVENTGPGGNIAIAANTVNLLNQSFIIAQTNQLSSGNAGNLSITANQLNLQDGSFLSGATSGQGRGSIVRLEIADTLTLTGTDTANTQTGIFLNSFNSGNAGSLEILNTRQLTVQGGALISASAAATGQAGNISINTPNGIVQVTGVSNNPRGQTASSILSETRNSGRAGDIRVNARQVLIQAGGQISAQTISSGQAGTLAVNATERLEISGTNGIFNSRLFFNSADVGNAGGIQINTNQITLRDGGQIAVSGTGTGVSGNIGITADAIALMNRGRIQAKTSQSEGGNIFLRLANQRVSLYMENNSEITAEAAGFANAGNITIDARGLILSRSLADNNDIVANAILGRGGRIGATATLILGFRQFQGRRTPESDFTSLSDNPSFPGELFLNTEASPNQPPLLEAPLPDLVQATCQPRTQPGDRSEFMIRGAGGVPSRPDDAMSQEAIAVGLATPTRPSEQRIDSSRRQSNQPLELVEAQQIVQLPDGTIALVAATPAALVLPMLGCQTAP